MSRQRTKRKNVIQYKTGATGTRSLTDAAAQEQLPAFYGNRILTRSYQRAKPKTPALEGLLLKGAGKYRV